MTKKSADENVFLKVDMPPEVMRDLDDCLKLRGLIRCRAWMIRTVVEAFIADTKEKLEKGLPLDE